MKVLCELHVRHCRTLSCGYSPPGRDQLQATFEGSEVYIFKTWPRGLEKKQNLLQREEEMRKLERVREMKNRFA